MTTTPKLSRAAYAVAREMTPAERRATILGCLLDASISRRYYGGKPFDFLAEARALRLSGLTLPKLPG